MKNCITLLSCLIILIFIPDFTYSGESDILSLSVEDVRFIAADKNLDIKLAELDSKIKGTELSYKEAAFDTIFNAEIGYTDDERKKSSTLTGSKSLTNHYSLGLDKKLKSGTEIETDLTNKREWTDSSFVTNNPYHESEFKISLTQPIAKNFFGMIDRNDIEIVKYEIRNAELESYIKIESTLINTEKAYWNLVLNYYEFKARKDMFKKAVLLFNQYRRKLKIGLVESGDILATEANMHLRESELLTAKNNLISAEENLKLLLNLKSNIRLIPKDNFRSYPLNLKIREELNYAFENRRDYQKAKNDLKAKKINLKTKKNSLFPEIDLEATFAANGIDGKYYKAVKDIAEDSNPYYYVGVKIKFPLENNEAESLHEKASLEKMRSIISLRKTERAIITEVAEKIRNVKLTENNLKSMMRIEKLQNGKLLHEEERFKYGRSDSDTLIRYQEHLLQATLKAKRAFFEYKVALLELMDSEDIYLKHIGLE